MCCDGSEDGVSDFMVVGVVGVGLFDGVAFVLACSATGGDCDGFGGDGVCAGGVCGGGDA